MNPFTPSKDRFNFVALFGLARSGRPKAKAEPRIYPRSRKRATVTPGLMSAGWAAHAGKVMAEKEAAQEARRAKEAERLMKTRSKEAERWTMPAMLSAGEAHVSGFKSPLNHDAHLARMEPIPS